MEIIKKICNGFNKLLPVLVLAVCVLAFFVPSSLTWASAKTTLLLQIIMFGMGLLLTGNDFVMVFKRPGAVIMVEVIQFVWMPLSAFLWTKLFGLEAGLAVGVILVGCCPGGTASNVMTYVAKGDVPLSVTCTTISTLVKLYAGAVVEVSLYSMFMSIVKVVLVPIVLGIVINLVIGKYINPIKSVMPLISGIGVLLVLGGVVAVNHNNIVTSGVLIFACCLCQNVGGLVVGHFLAKLFKFTKPQQRACAIEIGMQNAGLASNLAMANFEPISALAGAAFGLWHNFTGALYARIVSAKDDKEAAVN